MMSAPKMWDQRNVSPLTAERLRSAIIYNHVTGKFFWTGNVEGTQKHKEIRTQAHKNTAENYIYITIDSRRYLAHRLAWLYVHGIWPDGHIDHINRRRNDNRLENLRLASSSENGANSRVQVNSRTGVKGVTFRNGKYQAAIRCKYIGTYDSLQEAADAYKKEAEAMYGEFANPDRSPHPRRYTNDRPKPVGSCRSGAIWPEPVAINPMSKKARLK